MRYFQLRTESVLKSTSDLCTEKNPTCRATIIAATSRGYQYVCLDRTQGTCRVRYQYRGHLSRPKSLVGIFRQVTTLKSDRIVRFAQKTKKKFYPTKKQTENLVCSLSDLIISQ